MKLEDIKNKYFYYCCNINCFCRDEEPESKENIIKIIEDNSFNWTKEFQDTIGSEMLKTQIIIEFCSLYSKYLLSCKTIENFFSLSKILFKVISSKQLNFDGLFNYYYDVVFYTKNISYKKIFASCESLIEYYNQKDKSKKNELLEMTKIVLAMDKFCSVKYNKIKELVFKQ